jgi:oxygen-independent coproporphyrinogen III oxidase
MSVAIRSETDPALLAAPAPTTPTAGLYVHVPFCARLCPYCDFDTQDRDLHLISPYAEALTAEVALLPPLALHSIFFGGGTPSVLRPEQLGAFLAACRGQFDVPVGCEITAECNPNNVREGRLTGYRAAGVNRISLGVQTMDDATLRLLGRQHTAARVRQAVAAVRAAGFADLSLDLMYGLPDQTVAAWGDTLESALDLRPEHFSCYLLTLEEWTPMGQQVARGELRLPDDDTVAEQYALTRTRLAAAGYRQYEISNWALPGHESRHNLGYWRCEPYLGLGPGAVARIGDVRAKQTPHVGDYLQAIAAGRRLLVEEEHLTPGMAQREAMMLGLRLRAGLDMAAYRRRFGVDLAEVTGPSLDELLSGGFLEWYEDRLRLTDTALLVSNEVLVRIGVT